MMKVTICNQINAEESPVFTFIGQADDARDNFPDVVNSADIQQFESYFYNKIEFDRNVALTSNYGFWE